MTDNFKGMLGLCRKAGKVVPGVEMIEKSKKKCVLLVSACDVSERTARKIKEFNIKTIHTDMTKDELGSALGLGNVAVIGITESGFATALESKQGVQ